MREIGRLREEAFRFYGGGTGRDCDVDEFDLADDGYRQLIVWDPAEGAILGGYRFMFGDEVQMDEATGRPRLATAELFEFSPPLPRGPTSRDDRAGTLLRLPALSVYAYGG